MNGSLAVYTISYRRALLKPLRTQIRVGSGVPGNGTVRQSAKAQSALAIGTTPLFTPAGVSDVAVIKDACVVSRLAGVRPSPDSDWVVPLGPTNRSHTGPVIDEPFGFLAIGTSMPSVLPLAVEIGISPCQALFSSTWPRRQRKPSAPEYGPAMPPRFGTLYSMTPDALLMSTGLWI